MSRSLERELAVGIAALKKAGEVCRHVQSQITPDVLEKQDKSPVTVADFASQGVICRAIADAFPTDPIVAEEDARDLREPGSSFATTIQSILAETGVEASQSEICDWIDVGSAEGATERFWTLDPIDGTKGFLRKQQFAISLALIEDGEVALGLLGCPNLPAAGSPDAEPSLTQPGALLYAIRGGGAFQRPFLEPEPTTHTISATVNAAFADARLCESVESGHSKHDVSAEIKLTLGIAAEPARLDSQAKYALLGRGDAEIYLRLPTRAGYREKIWDHAGGVIVVEEAGGTVTDCAGDTLDFSLGTTLSANRGIIATAGVNHAEVVQAVREKLSV